MIFIYGTHKLDLEVITRQLDYAGNVHCACRMFSVVFTCLAGLSLLLDPADTECVLTDSESDGSDGEDGPSSERTTGSRTRPWNRPNTTVRLNT